jgi:hypothetical protein
VDARYISWIIITQDGQTVSGMIVEETETAIRLRESGGKEHIIDRAEIDAIRSLEQSLMPAGLEKDMSAQDLSDVIVFLGGIASPPKFVGTDAANAPLPRYPPEIAPFLLDESESTERRQQVIDQRPGMGPAIVSLLVAGIEPDDIQEEYRRIPWIWRVSIAVGKRNDGGEIRDLLETSVPAVGSPLRDWQAVVIGGGLINGVSQLGLWPQRRLAEILSSLPALAEAWPGALERAAVMANDEGIRSGTRYDALRMVALLGNQRAEQQLQLYLKQGTPTELQMGAVSGLSDMNSPTVVQPLIDSLEYLVGPNRRLAIEGLLRSDHRAEALRKWIVKRIQSGGIALTPAEVEALKQHRVESIRRRALEVFENVAETER